MILAASITSLYEIANRISYLYSWVLASIFRVKTIVTGDFVGPWSVVITTRNRVHMLERAIRSCLAQTEPCEIIVIDEASTDGTKELMSQFPSVVYMRNDIAVGHSRAANSGIRAAAGEWIKPLDDDDWLLPECIAVMSRAVGRAVAAGLQPTIVSGRAENVNEEGGTLGLTPLLADGAVALRSHQLLEMMMVDQASIGTPVQVGHSRMAAIETGGWNENREFTHQHGDEIECWIRLASRGDALFLPQVIAKRTIWPGGSQDGIPHYDRFISNVSLKMKIAEVLGIKLPVAVKSYLALHWGLLALRHGRLSDAVKLLPRAAERPQSLMLLLKRRKKKQAKLLSVDF